MCYYVSTRVRRALKNDYKDGFHLAEESEVFAGYDLPDLPATFQAEAAYYLPLQWGLIPAWAKDAALAQKLQKNGRIARAETMFEKPMFRDAALHRRCLIWLDGFFDFKHEGKIKTPFIIQKPDHGLFAVAALESEWINPETGDVAKTCALVTTPPNELMQQFNPPNPRMPLILPELGQQELWLAQHADPTDIHSLCRPLPEGILTAVPQDPREMDRDTASQTPPQLKLF